jgi:hypothetical protein
VDRIDYNIEQVATSISAGVKELEKVQVLALAVTCGWKAGLSCSCALVVVSYFGCSCSLVKGLCQLSNSIEQLQRYSVTVTLVSVLSLVLFVCAG